MKQRIAIYLRLSLEDVDKHTNAMKDESNSIALQRLLINNYLDQMEGLNGLPRDEFCDDGYSGTSFERPDFVRMIELAKRGEISCIAVKDLSRFGRDYLEVGDYLEHIFPFLGIRFVSVNDRYDSAMHIGKTIGMDVALKNIVYDYYSKDLSKKVKSAMGLMQRDCRFVTSAPYGYRIDPEIKHKIIIDHKTAPIVRRIFTSLIEGKTTTEIALELNMEKIPTPAEYKGITRKTSLKKPEWTHRTILTIIQNIKYTGTMVNHTRESRFLRDKSQRRVPKEEWYCKEEAHEAIVSKEEYEQAQLSIAGRAQRKRTEHDQSDRVFYCGHCGGKLGKENGTVFACESHRYHQNNPCKQVRFRKKDMENVLLETLKKQIKITRIEATELKRVAKIQKDNSQNELAKLNARQEACEREKYVLYTNYREGILSVDDYLAAREINDSQIESLQERINRIEKQDNQHRLTCEVAEEKLIFANRMSDFNDDKLREHLYDAIEQIVVYNAESIEIVWKFNDISGDGRTMNAGVGA